MMTTQPTGTPDVTVLAHWLAARLAESVDHGLTFTIADWANNDMERADPGSVLEATLHAFAETLFTKMEA